MEYTVQKLANMAGVSARTLRYYDEIGLLQPIRHTSSGYRIYGRREVARLQQILFYREMGLELADIQDLLDDPDFDAKTALENHIRTLYDRRRRLDVLIANAKKSLLSIKGEVKMNDTQRFEGFKKEMIDENEKKYGEEIREKYGDETVDASNRKLMNLSQEEYDEMTRLSEELNATLKQATKQGDPHSDLAQKAAALHKQWLSFTWPSYSKEAHMGLAQMYVDDPRFTAYYEKIEPGAAQLLCEAVRIFCSEP